MKLTLPKVPLTAFAALALFAGSARAVTVSSGDLILGFRASGGQGSDKNLTINLGPASNYFGAAPGSFVVSGLSALDLSTTYGNGWATRADLSWGIAGTTGSAAVGTAPARTLWATRAETTAGTPSTPWLRGGTFTLQVPSQSIAAMYTGAPGSLSSGSATPNSAVASLIDASLGGSWSKQEAFTPGVSFQYFNPSVMNSMDHIAGGPSAYDGSSYGVLDIFDVRPGTAGDPAQLIGAFGLNSAGKLVFSTNPGVFAAVPEPSAVLTGFSLLCALFLRRRR